MAYCMAHKDEFDASRGVTTLTLANFTRGVEFVWEFCPDCVAVDHVGVFAHLCETYGVVDGTPPGALSSKRVTAHGNIGGTVFLRAPWSFGLRSFNASTGVAVFVAHDRVLGGTPPCRTSGEALRLMRLLLYGAYLDADSQHHEYARSLCYEQSVLPGTEVAHG